MIIRSHTEELTAEMMSLLLTADPDKNAIDNYLEGSTVLVAFNNADDSSILGIAILVIYHNKYELKNIAVSEIHQERGIAKGLIARIKEEAKNLGGSSLYVGTGSSSLSQLALYQKMWVSHASHRKRFFCRLSECHL
jgi:N-acetylglutamate synthase-like GNAT family acetyltransferase